MKLVNKSTISFVFALMAIMATFLFQYTNIFADGGLLPCKYCVYLRFVVVFILCVSILSFFIPRLKKIINISWLLVLFISSYMTFIKYFPEYETCSIEKTLEVDSIVESFTLDDLSFANNINKANSYGYFEIAKKSCTETDWDFYGLSIFEILNIYVLFYFFIIYRKKYGFP